MKSTLWMRFSLLALFSVMLSSGCSSLYTKAKESVGLEPTTPDGEPIAKFSENPSVLNVNNRNYKRMTRSRMEEESELNPQAGSTWVMEGQGAYLFAQNKSRREGDLLNVKIEGSAQKQIETKVSVIKKLLKQLETEDLGGAASPPGQGLADKGADAKRAPAAAPKDEKEEALQLDMVPTRIVERLADGNYRIKGQQPFMIGKREYKVIVTGLIRPEDFNDEGINSGKLLDPQYDVISIRKKEKVAL